MDFTYNINNINEKISKAAEKSGRKFEDILLLPATKCVEAAVIKNLLCSSITQIGENRVNEMLDKYDALKNDFKFHFIGTLQSNKVKYVIDKVCLIHSVNSIKLAEEIQKQSAKHGISTDILIEVNIENEASKTGIAPNEITELLQNISQMQNITVRGLMAIPPFDENINKTREYFKKTYKLFIDIRDEKMDNIYMQYLSMGMSNDYEIAIEEGANIVRIGTGIFGIRNYNIGGGF